MYYLCKVSPIQTFNMAGLRDNIAPIQAQHGLLEYFKWSFYGHSAFSYSDHRILYSKGDELFYSYGKERFYSPKTVGRHELILLPLGWNVEELEIQELYQD